MSLNFTCSKCGNNTLDEVMSNVTVISVVLSVDEDGDLVYGDRVPEGGTVDAYQCGKCGKPVTDDGGYPIVGPYSLAEFLSK